MKSKNTKRLLVGLVFLAVSLAAFARGKPDNRSHSQESDRPGASAQQPPQRQSQPPSSVKKDNPRTPPASSDKSIQPNPPSNARRAPTRVAMPRTAPPAAKLARSSNPAATPARSGATRTPPQSPRANSVKKTTPSAAQSASKPPEKSKDSTLRPADWKDVSISRQPHTPKQTVADSRAQSDSSPASSSHSQTRLNTRRHVIVAQSSAHRNRQSEPAAAEKEENPSSKKMESTRRQSVFKSSFAPRPAASEKQKTDSEKKSTAVRALSSDGSSRRVIVSRIDRSGPFENRRTPAPDASRKLTSLAQPDRQSLIRAADLNESPRRYLDSHLRPPHTLSRNHHDRYDSRITITPEKKVIVVGEITAHRPRPYIPRRLHPDLVIVRSSPRWRDCGSYFSLTFSLNSCARLACVPYGTSWGLTYYYPRYHRRYVFVSIGGWWPYEYRYVRYYWYGCHPYYWYGPTVITPTPVIEHNTFNTYNYYGGTNNDSSRTTSSSWKYPFGDSTYDVSGYIEKISAPDAPQYQTAADLCFDRAVTLFLAGKYLDAAAQFREAIRISPDDIILPFTYSQALFAAGDYAHAASVLRSAVAAIPDDQLTIYYPRGLYEKEETLFKQIETLEKLTQTEPFAADFHLLLGYQYIGIEKVDKAAEHLNKAAQDPANQPTAQKLLDLLTQLKEQPEEDEP